MSNFKDGNMFGAKDIKKGKTGEEMTARFYNSQGWMVYDMSGDPEFRKVDIDFVMEKDGQQQYVEAKYSSKIHDDQGCLENWLDYDKRLAGWLWYTEADVIAIANKKRISLFWRDELRDFLEKALTGVPGYRVQRRFQIDSEEQNKYYAGRRAEICFFNVAEYQSLGYQVSSFDIKKFNNEFKFYYKGVA